MEANELAALHKDADVIHAADIHLGRLLHNLIDHIARLDRSVKDETPLKLKVAVKGDTAHAN